MVKPPLPSPWNLYNLLASPFFQGFLSADIHASAPLSLFVGRATELAQVRTRVHGAGNQGTRQAISGAPGVGKTTLVQEVKALLQRDEYLTSSAFVSVQPHDTPAQLFGGVLSAVYDTIIANRPRLLDHPTMREAQLLVRASRLGSRSGGVSVAGFGIQGGGAPVPVTPSDILFDGPRVLRDLMRLIAASDARGVVVHINNLENLTDSEARVAAEVLRALRDPMMMHDRLHVLFVGTSDAIRIAVDTHPQVRSVVTHVPLGSLTESEVKELLAARYRHLTRDPMQPFIQPVSDQAVERLHRLYAGDLRSLLRSLEDGVTPLLGMVGSEGGTPNPVSWEELADALRVQYEEAMETRLEASKAEHLTAWGQSGTMGPMTQEALRDLWGLSKGGVSQVVNHLVQQGYVVAQPRRKREPIQYTLSGTSGLIFGLQA